MTVEAIQDAIRELSVPEMSELAGWIQEMKEEAWDRKIEEDCKPGGRAERLIARLDAEIEAGNYTSYAEGLRQERARRAEPRAIQRACHLLVAGKRRDHLARLRPPAAPRKDSVL